MDDEHGDTHHVPILVQEILTFFPPQERETLFLDATAGGGGHSAAFLESDPRRRVISIDRDQRALERASRTLERYGTRSILVHAEFGQLEALDSVLADTFGDAKIGFNGIFADLGISSDQLDDPDRGFSFRREGRLDMRMDTTQSLDAETIVNNYDAKQLTNVFRRGGLRTGVNGLVSEILARRPVRSTLELASICEQVIGRRRRERPSSSHSATVPFQAIRMEVNDELGNIDRFLSSAKDRLTPGGRLAVLTFHSLEDERITRAMRAWSRSEPGRRGLPVDRPFGAILTRDAVEAGEGEREENPRSRSARLRVFERFAEQ
ncbi:MAG: 16S rRNA (cytosine(1402)-N(4))-methyltransferase RsmH [Deltaproteobacteria bacterium]|nr:16S rRNA (cytosine(1402)-N(4))-methyltransferase RsmH [Deltaproteobacteria bacterium]